MSEFRKHHEIFLKKSEQSGFIQAALLFGIALMTAVLGGFALANRSPTSQTDVEQAKVNASVILKQASDLRDGVSRYSSDFGSSAVVNSMTFDATTTDGLFNPTARYASPQIMPSAAFDTASVATADDIQSPGPRVAGHWYLNKLTLGNGLGDPGTPDPMVVLPYLRREVCERVNTLLYGSDTIPTAGTSAIAVWVDDSGDGLAGETGAVGWPEGCVQTSDNFYVYFKAIQEN